MKTLSTIANILIALVLIYFFCRMAISFLDIFIYGTDGISEADGKTIPYNPVRKFGNDFIIFIVLSFLGNLTSKALNE